MNLIHVANAASGGTSIDFTFEPRSITFPAGETEYIIDVEINDDNIFERGNETFGLTLSDVLFPPFLPVEIDPTNSRTTVLILDDDRMSFQCTYVSYVKLLLYSHQGKFQPISVQS